MTTFRLLLRNLAYHWRGNSAVCLGVAVSAAVLTGALLVGDALRGSLRDLTLQRLGWVDQALVAPRFIRAQVASDLPVPFTVPALVLRGTAQLPEERRTVRQVNLYGIPGTWADSFSIPSLAAGGGRFPETENLSQEFNRAAPEVVLNRALADALGVQAGQEVVFRLPRSSDIPREALLGRRDGDAVVDEVKVKVRGVLADDSFGARFSLQPSVEVPRNAFLPLGTLQQALKLPGRINALFVKGDADLSEALHDRLTLDDWGLQLQDPKSRAQALFARLGHPNADRLVGNQWQRRVGGRKVPRFASRALDIPHQDPDVLTRAEVEAFYRDRRGYLSLESKHLLLEPWMVDATLKAADEAGLRAAPTLVYLANTISDGTHEEPYVVVAALDPTQAPPLGPFLPPGVTRLRDDQIVLVDWKNALLPFRQGATVTLTFFLPEQTGQAKAATATAPFQVAGTGPLPLQGPAADPDLTPEFPGLTDKTDILSWDPPPPFDPTDIQKRIKSGDPSEVFWEEYRTTPRAYITLKAGQDLWRSRFGNATSVRLAPRQAGRSLDDCAAAFRKALWRQLEPSKGGLVFEKVKADALAASKGGTDFAGLFLGFSSFLILAALLLVGLLFRLNLDRRASEIGLLLATGYSRGIVTWLLLGEGLILAALGAALGCAAALGYAALLLQLLALLWPGGALQSFLKPHYEGAALSLLIGFAGALAVSGLTIAWTLRGLARVPARALLAGRTSTEMEPGLLKRPRWNWWVAGISVVGAAALLACAPLAQDHEMKASTFFGSGLLLLTAALAALSGWMRGQRHQTVEGRGWWSIARLGIRNAARNPLRSLLTAGLLASAAFLVVAVESFRRQADAPSESPKSPSGGFNLVAESDLPLFADLASDQGREELASKLLPIYREQSGNDEAAARDKVKTALALLKPVEVVALRSRSGDDASCLNLYQPRRPRLLGVSPTLIERGGFQFAATLKPESEAERGNPWLLLNRKGEAVPVFGEKNTVEWMLKKGLGETLPVPDGAGNERALRISGLLQDSVFQSSLLLSQEHFLDLYPAQEGYNFFLIRTPAGTEKEVKQVLETALADRGFAVTPSAERLEAFLAVENTYLSTFQALGGLGLLLGSLGLAVVLLRGVWERRGELALLRALGYRRATLGWMVLAENGFLLLAGLAAGTLAALVSVAPHVLGGAGSIPVGHLALLLGLVPVIGLTAAVLAVAATLRAPLVPALRRE